jgi:VWFA-related protein
VLVWSAFWGPAALPQAKGESQGPVSISFVATGPGAEALSAGDVKLSADGKDQSIASLMKVAPFGSSTKLPPHTFSNRVEGATGAPNVVVIFLDGVNTEWKDDAATREATRAALERIKPEERVAIFVFGKTLKLLSDFTDDGAARAAKLKDFLSSEPAGPGYKDLVLPIPQSGTSRAGMYEEQEKMRSTFAALEGLTGNLKGLPGRKNLLWVSGDFPLLMVQFELTGSGRQSEGDVQRTAMDSYYKAAQDLLASFQAAGVAVYPVDARTVSLNPSETKSRITFVNPPMSTQAASRNPSSAVPSATDDTAAATRAAMANRVPINDLMRQVATNTGGAVFSNSKDLGEALRGALDDTGNAYVATFMPAKLSENGSLHKIKLQSKQKGTQFRVAPGFFAPAAADLQPPQRLAAALSSPLNLSEIGLLARLETDPADPAGLNLTLQVDPHDLELTRQGENWVGQVGVGSFQGSPSGEQSGKQMQAVQVTVSNSAYQKALSDGGGIRFDVQYKRAPAATFLRIAVIDMKIPKSGSILAALP